MYSDGLWSGQLGFDFLQGQVFLYSKPITGPTQPLIQCILGDSIPGGKTAAAWSCVSILSCCFMAWCLINLSLGQLYFFYYRLDFSSRKSFCASFSHSSIMDICQWIRDFLWSTGQSSWLQIQRSRVLFPALPDFLRSSGSGTGSTQRREYK
jgi:hypothetical protein